MKSKLIELILIFGFTKKFNSGIEFLFSLILFKRKRVHSSREKKRQKKHVKRKKIEKKKKNKKEEEVT